MLLFTICMLGACNCEALPPDTHIVTYIIEGKELYKCYAKTDEIIGMPEIEPREDSVFKGWYLSGEYIEKWDFEKDRIKKSTSLYAYWVAPEDETFNVIYYNADGRLSYEKIPKGGIAEQFIPKCALGYEFDGWYCGKSIFDFNEPIVKDYALTAKFSAINYCISFIADGEIIREITYTVEDELQIPEVPEKPYYTGRWEDFRRFEATEVRAIYEPITYTATFIDEGKILKRVKYTAEDTVAFPELPEKYGYMKEWENVDVSGGDLIINSVATPIVYKASYVADGKIISIVEFTVEDKYLNSPTVPNREGYDGAWENTFITANNIVVNAIYTIKAFTAKFIIDGVTVATRKFQIDNMTVEEPDLPERDGFTARWQAYILTLNDISIYAEYLPITYYANFYAEGILVASVPFTAADKIICPTLPERAGYYGEWESFEQICADMLISAAYSPILYSVNFVCDGKIIDIQKYTVEFKNITIPSPLEKDGYTVLWDNFELTYGDITVNAIYTPIIDDGYSDEFIYSENPDGSLTIAGYNGAETEIIIPSVHNGKRIIAIGKQAFMNGNFETITIREGIKSIAAEAFQGCAYLTDIILPKSLESIGDSAFAFSSVKGLKLPYGIKYLGQMAFTGSKLEGIELPDSITAINKAFYCCYRLEEIILGAGITEIENQDFFNCTSLTSITIPKNVNSIKHGAFNGCSELKSIRLEDLNGWTIRTESGETIKELSPAELADASEAARLILNVYYSRSWFKN